MALGLQQWLGQWLSKWIVVNVGLVPAIFDTLPYPVREMLPAKIIPAIVRHRLNKGLLADSAKKGLGPRGRRLTTRHVSRATARYVSLAGSGITCAFFGGGHEMRGVKKKKEKKGGEVGGGVESQVDDFHFKLD